MVNILIDTCVWISFSDERERQKRGVDTDAIYEHIRYHEIIFPWPIAYETIRTKMVKDKIKVHKFESMISNLNISWVDDASYRESSWKLALENGRRGQGWSMVDCFIHLYIEDPKTKVDALITYNERDFYSVCALHKVELLTAKSDWS